MSGQVTARQMLDPETEPTQPGLCQVDLPMFERILLTAAYQEGELAAVGIK